MQLVFMKLQFMDQKVAVAEPTLLMKQLSIQQVKLTPLMKQLFTMHQPRVVIEIPFNNMNKQFTVLRVVLIQFNSNMNKLFMVLKEEVDELMLLMKLQFILLLLLVLRVDQIVLMKQQFTQLAVLIQFMKQQFMELKDPEIQFNNMKP